MRTLAVAFILLIAGTACSHTPTEPTATVASVAPAVAAKTAPTTLSVPPSCAWRDHEVAAFIAGGGNRNTIIQLSDGHRVFLQDVGYDPGYVVFDYPTAWCTGPAPLKTRDYSDCFFYWPCDLYDN